MKSIFLKSVTNQLHCYSLSEDQFPSLDSFKQEICDILGIPTDQQALYHNGRLISTSTGLENLSSGSTIDVNLRLQGGKGGFGSLLRGQAISKRKITNFDASRDLQGRRIRHVKYQQKIMEWAKKRKEEEKLIKKEVDEYTKQQKEIQGVQKDFKIAQEFKDKIDKWDNEMTKSIRAGAKKAKKGATKPPKAGVDNLDDLDDFVEPMAKKKVCTEKTKTVLKSNGNKDDDVLDVKISQKLAIILEDGNSNKETEAQNEGKESGDAVKDEKEGNGVVQNGKVEEKAEQKKEFSQIELNEIQTIDDLLNLGNDHLKHELMRLGLKCGGSLQEKAKRLYDIKLKPELLFNPKYVAKK